MRTVYLDITVPGEPVGTAYKAMVRGKHASIFMPSHLAKAMKDAAMLFRLEWNGDAPLDEPLTIEWQFVVGRPLYLKKKPGPRSDGSPPRRIPCLTKPDTSNCIKLYEDALKDAGVLRDDCIVVRHVAEKMFVALDPAEQPHVRVVVLPWSPNS